MRTLIITNSLDFTTDLIVNALGSDKVIRINYDRPKDWSININESDFSIKSSTIQLTDNNISKCNWRKPFISDINLEPYTDPFYEQEWKYMLYEIANFFKAKNKLLFNFPIPDYIAGKIYQQRIALKFFKTSPINASINKKINTSTPLIIKSLSAEPMQNGKVLYTTDVTNLELDDNFWFSQQKVESQFDVTTVFINGKLFSYELDRSKLKGIDWRKDQFNVAKEWRKIDLDKKNENSIIDFMNEIGYTYGRLDFLRNRKTSELIFLEVNKNGQWAWLDAQKDNGLFTAMVEAYDPNNP